MAQDHITKAVFREMDGFLVLISVLSTLQDTPQTATTTPATIEAQGAPSVNCARLVFSVLNEALQGDQENEDYFRVRLHSPG